MKRRDAAGADSYPQPRHSDDYPQGPDEGELASETESGLRTPAAPRQKEETFAGTASHEGDLRDCDFFPDAPR